MHAANKQTFKLRCTELLHRLGTQKPPSYLGEGHENWHGEYGQSVKVAESHKIRRQKKKSLKHVHVNFAQKEQPQNEFGPVPAQTHPADALFDRVSFMCTT